MNNPAQQARMKHVLHQYTGEWGRGYKRASGKPRASTMCLRSIWMTVRGSLSTRFKRRAPLVFETRITTVKCSTAWNVASQSESYLQPRWAIRCSALRLLSGSSPKTDGLDPIRCFLRPIALSSIARKRSVKRRGFCRISVFGFGGLLRSCCLIGSRGDAISRTPAGACSS